MDGAAVAANISIDDPCLEKFAIFRQKQVESRG
jgi:hypothetical protein